MRSFSPAQCGHVFLPVHLASKTGGVRLTTFSIAKSRKPIKNCSTGPSLLFFGRKIKVALVGIPALLGMPIFSWSRYAPVFEVEPFMVFHGVHLSQDNIRSSRTSPDSTLPSPDLVKSATFCFFQQRPMATAGQFEAWSEMAGHEGCSRSCHHLF